MTGLRLDRDIVAQRLEPLDRAVDKLSTHRGLPRADLEADLELTWMVQRGLLTCIQAVLDVSSHLVAALGAPTPSDYRGSIIAVGRLGVVPPQLAERMAPMAGFRNVLVHEYAAVDLEIVSSAINERLGDFREFVRHVVTFLQERDESGSSGAAH